MVLPRPPRVRPPSSQRLPGSLSVLPSSSRRKPGPSSPLLPPLAPRIRDRSAGDGRERGSQPTRAWPTHAQCCGLTPGTLPVALRTRPWTPGKLRGTSLGGPGYLELLWPRPRPGAQTGETAPISPPGPPLLTVASFHFICMKSSKTWTPLGRWLSALSGRLEMRFAPQVSLDSDLSVPCLFPSPPPPVPPQFTSSSVSSLYLYLGLPLVLALQSVLPRGSWTPD